MKKLMIAIVAGFMSMAVAGAYAADKMDKMDKMDKASKSGMSSESESEKDKKGKGLTRGERIVAHLTGRGNKKMTTDEIMALTRGE